MGLKDAVNLILNSEKYAKGGEIFISKMSSTNIYDLAISMIDITNLKFNLNFSKKSIKYVGIRPGEKLYEELINSEEINRTFESSLFYIVLPKIYGASVKNYNFRYKKYNTKLSINSNHNQNLNLKQIKNYLITNFDFD